MDHQEYRGMEASFARHNLEELAARVQRVLDIRDRTYGFPPRTYETCFVGHEAVQKLVDENIASDEEDAVRIGNILYVSLQHSLLPCGRQGGCILTAPKRGFLSNFRDVARICQNQGHFVVPNQPESSSDVAA